MELERKYADFAAEKAIELIGIDSPSGFTGKAAEWVRNEFEALGFAARMTEKGGFVGRLGRENFCQHIDDALALAETVIEAEAELTV